MRCWAALRWTGFFGDPAWLTHPVVIMGKAISALERALRARLPKTPRGERLGGLTLAIVLPVGTLLLTGGVCLGRWARFIRCLALRSRLLWCAQALAATGLAQESTNVYRQLEKDDLPAARRGGQPHRRPGHGEADARGRDESGGGDGRRKRERRRDRAPVLHDPRRRAAGADL